MGHPLRIGHVKPGIGESEVLPESSLLYQVLTRVSLTKSAYTMIWGGCRTCRRHLQPGRAGLRISSKTKLLLMQDHNGVPPPALLLRDFSVEAVSSFTYLGSEVNSNLDLAATIGDRLSKAGAVLERI